MAASKHIKIKLREVNRHLVCRLCRGYYVDATTIAECLHSFCRSCIIKYLEKNSFCPICEVQIHKTKPYLNLRLDKALQDVVYKLVPGLYHDEMKRRRDFYSKRQEQIPFATPEQCGLEERIIFSPEDSISLSLEYLESDDFESETVSSQSSESGDNQEGLSFPQQLGLMKLKSTDGKTSRRESQDVQETSPFSKRYLQCPAVVNVGHLKKFIRMKNELTDKMQVSIIHKRVHLPDHYTLMDVAYIYTWKRSAPLRFFYQIYRTKKHKLKMPPALKEKGDSEPQSATSESRKAATEKLSASDLAKSPLEVKKSLKSSSNRCEVAVSELKPTVQKNVLKNIDSNKPVAETKSETTVKSDGNTNEVTRETKEAAATQPSTPVVPLNSKANKSKLNGPTENKHKAESQKRKSAKMENGVNSAQEVKENETKNHERLLLNPISGQLESVPSTDQYKSAANGVSVSEEKKETGGSPKKEVANKGQKKPDLQNSKDSKKSNVNLLKSFRKEKSTAGKGGKLEIKNNKGSSLTITTVSKNEKTPEKEKEKEKEVSTFSVEIKAENKESEYDFDGSSPPSKIIPLQEFSKYSKYSKYMAEHRDKWLSKEKKNNWMSLQDFREKVLKENDTNDDDAFLKSKRKTVPSLYKINSEGSKLSVKKSPNAKPINDKPKGKMSPTIINIKTENGDKKGDVKVEVVQNKTNSLPPLKIESKDGEYSVKPASDQKSNAVDVCDTKPVSESKQNVENKSGDSGDSGKANALVKDPIQKTNKEKSETESENQKRNATEGTKKESPGAMDLTKAETTPKSSKNPLENLMDLANKTPRGDEKIVEALLSAAQKQSIEPLLKIPQYSQIPKNSVSQSSLSPGKNISPSDISQALQFLEDLRSDIKVLESKNPLNPNSVLEQFAQKTGNFEPYQQLYQQKIDLIRRLKRHQQIMPNDSETPPRKHLKLSPTSESKKKLSPSSEQKAKTSPVLDEVAQYKSSMDRTLSQIQLMELHSRMIAAHNYKTLPALLQLYNRPSTFATGPTSPSKSSQQKIKPSCHSPPNKSSQSVNSPSGNSPLATSNAESPFFTAQSYGHLINAGLSSEMTYHQMFQSYLNQQEQMNQVKLSQMPKKPVKFSEVSPKSISDKYYSSQTTAKKVEINNSPPSAQKS